MELSSSLDLVSLPNKAVKKIKSSGCFGNCVALVAMETDLKLSGRPANSSDLVSRTSLIKS